MTVSVKTIADYLEIKGRFRRSVHLEKDFNSASQNGDFILTPTARGVLRRLAEGMDNKSVCRAWTLTGPYGVGKSAFAVFLTRLLCSTDEQGEQARRQLGETDPQLLSHLYDLGVVRSGSKGFLPILATARRTAASRCLTEGIVAAALSTRENIIEASVQNLADLLEPQQNGQPWDTRQVINGLASLSESAKAAGYAGVLFIVDELGKLFEYAARYPQKGDVFILQELAEQAARSSESPILFVGLLHQSFTEYGQYLDIGTRREWAKIQGRFEDIAFLEPTDQVIRMIAKAIRWIPDAKQHLPISSLEEVVSAASKAGIRPPGMQAADFEEIAGAAYPLHPTTLVALPFVFRRFAQNERSLFSYLNSLEPYGFQEFIKSRTMSADTPSFVRLGDLFDYFTRNFGAGLYRHPQALRWMEAADVLERKDELDILHREVIKTIGVLNALGEFCHLNATEQIISLAVSFIDSKSLLPPLGLLRSWPANAPLKYAPKARLNLKLFAFLGASKLETRHESHRQHYRDIIGAMRRPEKLSISGAIDSDEVLRTLENLFLGFQGIGGQRTWCAASFLPIVRELIAGESIWQETKAKREGIDDWYSALSYFSHSQQIFLARGGELLYLQLCNAFRQDSDSIRSWANNAEISLSDRERDPTLLFPALEKALSSILDSCPETVSRLAEFIDTGVDTDTADHTDFQTGTEELRFVSCGWCPEESWREGALFAIELLRLCEAAVDPIDRLDLLETACAMQVLRSLCAQSSRYALRANETHSGSGPLGFVWVVSDSAGRNTMVKQISRRNVISVQRLIYDAVRHPNILLGFSELGQEYIAKVYKDVDSRYGHKLFLTIAKRIGFIVPRRGTGARFVFTERLLRFLVLVTIRPGERVTYETFKKLIFAHYGLAVDEGKIGRSCEWSGTAMLTTLGGDTDAWLTEMLDASGVLIRLSDSCSLVSNPFDGGPRS